MLPLSAYSPSIYGTPLKTIQQHTSTPLKLVGKFHYQQTCALHFKALHSSKFGLEVIPEWQNFISLSTTHSNIKTLRVRSSEKGWYPTHEGYFADDWIFFIKPLQSNCSLCTTSFLNNGAFDNWGDLDAASVIGHYDTLLIVTPSAHGSFLSPPNALRPPSQAIIGLILCSLTLSLHLRFLSTSTSVGGLAASDTALTWHCISALI